MSQNPARAIPETESDVPIEIPVPVEQENLTDAGQERAWVEQTLAGNTEAFANLVERYRVPVYNLAYRMLGRAADAEDAAQEAFVRAYMQLGTYEPTRKFSTWLLSITAHYCIDQLRRKSASSLDAIEGFDAPANPAEEPEEVALDKEQRELVRKLLDTLPASYRGVTVLRYFYDMSYAEIAQTLKLTESAVKTRLHRAREMLADRARSMPELAALSNKPPSGTATAEVQRNVPHPRASARQPEQKRKQNGFVLSFSRLQPSW